MLRPIRIGAETSTRDSSAASTPRRKPNALLQGSDGELKYNKLVEVDTLEKCAANLEAMRIKFLRMGGTQHEIVGAFQSNFLFLESIGVRTSTSLEGPRYVALVRTGDGRLAVPGAMPQPAP